MACVNPNSPEFKAALERIGNPLLAEIEIDKGVQIKPGVAELFESNLELANAVYEALGFTGAISLKSNLKNTGKTEQELIEYLKKKYPEIKLNITNNPIWEYDEEVFNQFFNKKIKNIALVALISYGLWNTNVKIINSNIQYKDDTTTSQILEKIASSGYVYTDSNGIIIDKNDTVNKEAYVFLKRLWEKAGYPKIVIKTGEGKSRYNPITNSITINIIRKDDVHGYIEIEKDKNGNNIYGISADLFLAELAHGLQAAQGKMYVGKQIIDFIKSGFIYDNSYEIKGTLEYEAHEEIEPLLVKEFENYLYQQTLNNKIIGQANIKAMTVIVDAINKKADTIPHEYAHHYIAWFRDTKIVQEGIKRFGSEEALVQAIGEQVIKQKGEAYNWWKKFTNFILNLLSDKKLLQVLTDSFLNRADLSNDFTYNEITPQQKQQAQQLYSQYLNSIFPDSKVKDIVYHGTPDDIQEFDKTKSQVSDVLYFSNDKKDAEGYRKSKRNRIVWDTGVFEYNGFRYAYKYDQDKKEYYYLKKDVNIGSEKLDVKTARTKYETTEKEFKDAANKVLSGGKVISSLLNIKNLYNGVGEDLFFGGSESFKKEGYDGFITNDDGGRPSIFAAFEPEQIHILGSKQDIEGFKKFINTEAVIEPLYKPIGEEYNLQYQFKAVANIYDNLDRVNKLWKQLGNTSTFWNKIQQDFQIPKDQINLLKESEGNSIEEKLASFAANYSYAVEINLGRTLISRQTRYFQDENQMLEEDIDTPYNRAILQSDGRYKVILVASDGSEFSPGIFTREEAIEDFGESIFEGQKLLPKSDYYSDLTVPGGTNYTENEIATPAITPSIKGHAEFATDNGIGWFRSDDKMSEQDTRTLDRKISELSDAGIIERDIEGGFRLDEGEGSKTRRILEVQSDLFQKGRDKGELVIDRNDYNKERVSREELSEAEKNGSYEKVPFSSINWTDENTTGGNYLNISESGRTSSIWASKYNDVFYMYDYKLGYPVKFTKKKSTQNQFLQLLNKDNNWVTFFIKSIIQDSAKKGYEKVLFPRLDTIIQIESAGNHKSYADAEKAMKDEKWHEKDKTLRKILAAALNKPKEDQNQEHILRLREQIAAHQPSLLNTAKFYEETLTNVLKKQGYNPVLITDEYGNTWNEIEISSERDSDTIYLQKEKQSVKESNKELDDKIKDFLASIGVNIKTLSEIKDANGNIIDAVAKADMLNKIIEVVQGRADITTLSEEAAHFFVEMLGEDSPLFKEMYDKITGYKIYRETVSQYKDLKQYRNSDGTVNFHKLKKEAIAKLIMAHIIKNETGEEVSDKINTAKKWWAKVLNFIKKIFSRSKENPFKTAALSILTGDTSLLNSKNLSDEIYLQSESVVDGIDKLLRDQTRIKLDDTVDPTTGEKKHIYSVDGIPIVDKNGKGRSVNSVYVDTWYKERFPTDSRSDRQKMIDSLKADEGTKIHQDMQNIIQRYFNEDGTRRVTPLTDKVHSTNETIYKKLEDYFLDLLSQYPDSKTKFLSEVKIYDPTKNVAGTIDLVVILPDGSVDIYDWKSQEITKDQSELKWFKAPAYRIQMEEYKKILSKHYGFSKFNKLRAIPIKTRFSYKKTPSGYELKKVYDIEIGNADPSKIPDDKNYLLPVVMLYESTGDENLDELLSKLNAIYDILSNKKVKASEKNIKAQELNDLALTIRDLQVRKNLNSFIENGLYEIDKFDTKLKNNEFDIFNINEAIKTIAVYASAQEYLESQILQLKKQIDEEKDPDVKNYLLSLRESFLEMQGSSNSILKKLIKKRKELGDAYAKSLGVNTLLNTEKTRDWFSRTFRSTSSLDTAAMQTFYKTLKKAQTIRDSNILNLIDDFKKLEKSYVSWAEQNGKTGMNMFDYLLEFDKNGEWTGGFLNIYSKEFFKKREEALQNKDYKWLKANTKFDKEAYDEAYKEQIILLEERYPGSTEKIKEKREKALSIWVEKHSDKYEQAYINKYNTFIKPAEKWHSDKYKFIYEKDSNGNYKNAPLKDTYEYFQKMIRRSADLGMLDKFSSKFIPNMLKGLDISPNKILDDLQVYSDQGFSNIDELTGELRKVIPVFYTKDIEDTSKKSKDLFKVFAAWGMQMENYKAMSDIEEISEMILEIEKAKDSYAQNEFGKINKTKKIKSNDKNAELLENHINYYIYNREVSSGTDVPIPIKGKEYSLIKTARKTLKYMTVKTLGLNILSGTATFVGGKANAYFMSSKRLLFTEKEWAEGVKDFTSKDEVTVAAIYKLGLSLEDHRNKALRDLSVEGAMKHLNSDSLMFIQRGGDEWATLPVAATMLRTYMIGEGGKLVNIRKYVKDKNNYANFYNLSKDEQNKLIEKIDKEVEELRATKSLKVIAKIKNDKLVIPGITDNIDNATAFRSAVQKTIKQIIGNATRDDINQVRMSLAGNIMMQFRSWMPQMVTERFGDMTYSVDTESWEYGKARLFVKHLSNKNILPLLKELMIGFDTNTITKAKERYIEFLRRLKEEGKITDNSEFMTEAEFIDAYLGNLRSMMRELMMWLSFAALLFWVSGDDDKTGIRKWLAKAITKYKNEFAFYYSPGEFTSILKGPLPIMSLLGDTEKLFTNTIGQTLGYLTNDDEQMQKNHPLKYLNKILPITKELQTTYAYIDDDFRRDFDIKD